MAANPAVGKDAGKETAPEASATQNPSSASGVETVEESPRASKRVYTQWPTGSFAIEGIPEITMEGTNLTATQLKEAEKAAEANGVVLTVEDVDNA